MEELATIFNNVGMLVAALAGGIETIEKVPEHLQT